MKIKRNIQVILLLAAFIIILMFCSYVDSFYVKNAIVTDVKKETVILTDTQGFQWEYSKGNFTKGDKVKLTIHNNNTGNNICDDIIKKIKKRD